MSENGLMVTNEPNALMTFDREKINLIKNTVAKGADDQQLALFLHQAQRTGLDPLSRQIHCILRKNNKTGRYDMSIQVAIDGYRLIADRTGLYAGSDDYLFNNGLTQYQHIESTTEFPVTATATVYKIVAGIRVPFTATAAWGAYYPGEYQGFMWKKMPYLMIGKCAEALALRKAFPAELSGMYVREEMEQAGFVEVIEDDTPPAPPKPRPPQKQQPRQQAKPAAEPVEPGTWEHVEEGGATAEKAKHDMTLPDPNTVAMWREKVEKAHKLKSLTVAGMVANAVPYFDNDYHALQYTDYDGKETFTDNGPALEMFDKLVEIGTAKVSE